MSNLVQPFKSFPDDVLMFGCFTILLGCERFELSRKCLNQIHSKNRKLCNTCVTDGHRYVSIDVTTPRDVTTTPYSFFSILTSSHTIHRRIFTYYE